MSEPPRPPQRRQRGLVVARVAGIPVSIGASWLVLAVALIFIVVQANPGLGATAYGVGAAYALGLLVAVLAHEAAHAAAARSFGIVVHRIVADLWGGHTAFDGRLATPGRSAVIAVSGPLANLALALVGYMAETGMTAGSVSDAVVHGFVLVNLLLAVFNLLPGLPLDGGQLVDSLVWWVTGKRERGLIAGGWSGRVVIVGLAVWVLVLPLAHGQTPDPVTLLWTFVIGSFMWSGASSAIAVGRARRIIAAVRVREVIHPLVLVDAGTPLGSLGAGGGLPVARDETGLPTLVMAQIDPQHRPPVDSPVSSVMIRIPASCVVECGPDDDVTDLISALQSTGTGVAVVTMGGSAYGVATADAINARLESVSGS